VKQALQRFDDPKRKAIAAELHRLENVGFIKEIKTLSWVSNPIIVPQKNTDVHRIYVDYTTLKKHCPKDPFPLPMIDQIIDSTMGCARLLIRISSMILEFYPDLSQRVNQIDRSSNHVMNATQRRGTNPASNMKVINMPKTLS
jgi:hypothetical protein